MAVHDVSGELRGAHGRWSRSADALKRMSKEAAAAPSRERASGTEQRIASIEKGTTRRINGVAVHHVSDSRVRVGFKKQGGGWDYQHYSSRAEAAKAVDAGRHHKEGEAAPRPGHARTGPPPTAHPMAPEPRPAAGEIRLRGTPGSADRKTSLRARMMEHLNNEGKLAPNERLTLANRYADEHNKNPHPPSPAEYAGIHQRREQALAEQRGAVRNQRALAGRPQHPERSPLTGPPPTAHPMAPTPRTFEQAHSEYQKAITTRERLTGGRIIPGPLAVQSNQREIARLEEEMRGMGARRKSVTGVIKPGTNMHQWEMPPKPGTPAHTVEKLRGELSSITEQLHSQHEDAGAPLYTPQQLTEARRNDMAAQVRAGAKTIVVKVPSGSEIQMSQETARYLLYGEQPGASFERGTAQQAYLRSLTQTPRRSR